MSKNAFVYYTFIRTAAAAIAAAAGAAAGRRLFMFLRR